MVHTEAQGLQKPVFLGEPAKLGEKLAHTCRCLPHAVLAHGKGSRLHLCFIMRRRGPAGWGFMGSSEQGSGQPTRSCGFSWPPLDYSSISKYTAGGPK